MPAYGVGLGLLPAQPPIKLSHSKIPGRAIGGPGMQVSARRGHRSVPEGLLHQMDRRTPVEAMARVRMAQPVSRDLGREPGPFGCGFHDPVHGALIQGTPTLAGAEHRSVRSRTKRAAIMAPGREPSASGGL